MESKERRAKVEPMGRQGKVKSGAGRLGGLRRSQKIYHNDTDIVQGNKTDLVLGDETDFSINDD